MWPTACSTSAGDLADPVAEGDGAAAAMGEHDGLRVAHALDRLVDDVARLGDQPVDGGLAQLQDHAGAHGRPEVHRAVRVAVDRVGGVRDPVLVEEQRVLHAERHESAAADLGLGSGDPLRVDVHGPAAAELEHRSPRGLA